MISKNANYLDAGRPIIWIDVSGRLPHVLTGFIIQVVAGKDSWQPTYNFVISVYVLIFSGELFEHVK